MKIHRNFSLKNHNTFGLDVKAKQFVEIQQEDELTEVLQQVYASEVLILGGGSNMLLTSDIDKTVIYMHTQGKKVLDENEEFVWVRVAAGENWHQFVCWCLDQNYGGFENLSLIPGNVGTAPIQNIGAYGVELKDHFVSCEALHIQSLEKREFSNQDCRFGYRDSIFKRGAKGQYVITSVVVKLRKQNHELHTGYGAIQQALAEKNIDKPTIQDVAEAVIAIRQSKLPDPKEIGNSGSFFKNPVIAEERFQQLQAEYPNMPFYRLSDEKVKVPAGWLIEQTGYKGFRDGDAGVHPKQALVLVNYGQASGQALLALSKKIQAAVANQFSVSLETEVNILP